MAAKKKPMFFVLTVDGDAFAVFTQKELDDAIAEESTYNKPGVNKWRVFNVEDATEFKLAVPQIDYSLEEVK